MSWKELPEYQSWSGMIVRCTSPKNKSYKDYGGRGITVCQRWRMSFLDFVGDVGLRPTQRHSLDRIDNAGHYEPGNVRWAIRSDQAQNRRSSVVVEWNGQTHCLAAWARRLGIDEKVLYSRYKSGLLGDRLFDLSDRRKFEVEHDGLAFTLSEWARRLGIQDKTLYQRYAKGDRGAILFRGINYCPKCGTKREKKRWGFVCRPCARQRVARCKQRKSA